MNTAEAHSRKTSLVHLFVKERNNSRGADFCFSSRNAMILALVEFD